MPRPMYFASFAKKVFLRAGRAGSAVTSRAHARWCARRVCGAQLVFCQRPDHGDTLVSAPWRPDKLGLGIAGVKAGTPRVYDFSHTPGGCRSQQLSLCWHPPYQYHFYHSAAAAAAAVATAAAAAAKTDVAAAAAATTRRRRRRRRRRWRQTSRRARQRLMQARKRWRRRVLPCINSASWSALRRLAALATPRRTLSCFGRTPRPITPRPRHAVGGRATSTAVLPWQARTLPALARIRPPLLQGIPPRRKPPASVGAALAFVLRPLLHCTTSCVPSSSPAPTAAARSASSSSPSSSASSASSSSTAAPGGSGAPGLVWPGLVRSTGR